MGNANIHDYLCFGKVRLLSRTQAIKDTLTLGQSASGNSQGSLDDPCDSPAIRDSAGAIHTERAERFATRREQLEVVG